MRASQEILELEVDELRDLVLDDELNVNNECQIFELIIKWIEHKYQQRRPVSIRKLNALLENWVSEL